MQKVLNLYKKEGETPLETIERFKAENPEHEKEKMTYAGRLDPMAEGVLLVLVGEECKNKEKYLRLSKEYEFEILWGFKTDTFDILGIPTFASNNSLILNAQEFENKLLKNIENLKGKQIFEYPIYSSATVGGKQLHQWAREGRVQEIDLPKREVEIFDIEFLGNRNISKENLLEDIIKRIKNVKGDFRQNEIIGKWNNIFDKNKSLIEESLITSKFKVKCSGGTYVRAIVNKLGEELGVGAVTYSIKRTSIY